jgi:tryptophanyl-tRNA synthetase
MESEGKGTFDSDGVKLSAWEAKGKFTDSVYDKLILEFGVEKITPELLERFERVTGHAPHLLMKRGLFFAHRQLNEILDDHEKGKKIILYTGRGPTESPYLHLGHILPMQFTVWLQRVFNAVVVFQMADDEKYWFKDLDFETVYRNGFENAKEVIALGFDPKRTFIFSNRDFSRNPHYQKVAFDMMKHVRTKDIAAIFGIPDSAPIGQMLWPVYQSTAAFSGAYKDIFNDDQLSVLVAYAIDQDPYFRLCRDIAPKLGFKKPSSIMCRFLPALEGDAKMSTTGGGPVKAIFTNDTPSEIKDKINKYAFSGGGATLDEHRTNGGNTTVDVCFQWLRHFLEDDIELETIRVEYEAGRMLTSQLKKRCIEVITDMIVKHQAERAKVTDEMVAAFYDPTNIVL